MTTQKIAQQKVTELQNCHHPGCIACRPREEGGLGLAFVAEPDGSMVGTFECDPRYQGYTNRLHGGIIALLLDAVMTHTLFAKGLPAVTARLNIKYRHPVDIDNTATVRGTIVRQDPPIFCLKAELIQDSKVRVTAEATFFCRHKD